jgi:hypothetical protein
MWFHNHKHLGIRGLRVWIMFVMTMQQVWWGNNIHFFNKNEYFLCRLLFVLNVIFPIKTNNKLIYVLFSHFIYNINPNHNFNQTYHAMIFSKKKSNHNFNQTHILYEPTTIKIIFLKLLCSNHNHNIYHKNKHS